jgi:pimeloyl-ACP methyl ester carboxylesterase
MKIGVTGSGATLLYLHDWGFPGQAWERQVEYFRARYRNVVLDFNLTACPEALEHGELLDHLCNLALEQLSQSDQSPRAVIAHGFGAFLAYELIDRGMTPEALVLIGGLVRFTNAEGYLSGLPQERVSSMRKALQTDAREMLRRYAQLAFSGEDESWPGVVNLALPYAATDFLRLSFDALITHDYAEMIPKLPCRALIMQGEHDRLCPVWQGELLRKLFRRSVFHLCKGAGHAPFLTQFAVVNRRIEQFLEQGT